MLTLEIVSNRVGSGEKIQFLSNPQLGRKTIFLVDESKLPNCVGLANLKLYPHFPEERKIKLRNVLGKNKCFRYLIGMMKTGR